MLDARLLCAKDVFLGYEKCVFSGIKSFIDSVRKWSKQLFCSGAYNFFAAAPNDLILVSFDQELSIDIGP